MRQDIEYFFKRKDKWQSFALYKISYCHAEMDRTDDATFYNSYLEVLYETDESSGATSKSQILECIATQKMGSIENCQYYWLDVIKQDIEAISRGQIICYFCPAQESWKSFEYYLYLICLKCWKHSYPKLIFPHFLKFKFCCIINALFYWFTECSQLN